MKFKNLFLMSLFSIFVFLASSGVSSGASEDAADPPTISSSGPVLLFGKPERGSKAEEVELEDGEKILEVKTVKGERWYRVKTGGKSGWVFSHAVCKYEDINYEEATEEMVDHLFSFSKEFYKNIASEKGWLRRPDLSGESDGRKLDIYTFAAEDALLQICLFPEGEEPDEAAPIRFIAVSPEASEKFLGLPVVGMTEEQIEEELAMPISRYGDRSFYRLGRSSGFMFYFDGGKVSKVVFSDYYQGEDCSFPKRTYELDRLLNKPHDNWPKGNISCKGQNVNIRSTPSLKGKPVGKVSEGDLMLWTKKEDRGEKYPWYEVEVQESGKPNKKGWVYGEFIKEDSEKPQTFMEVFISKYKYECEISKEEMIKRHGKPIRKTIAKFGEDEKAELLEWKGLENTLTGCRVTGPEFDIGGFRVGDPVESLAELFKALTDEGWNDSDISSLEEGENSFCGNYPNIIITIEEGKVKSFEFQYECAI